MYTLPIVRALITREEQEIPIEDSAAPIKDRTGKVIGVVLVFMTLPRNAERGRRWKLRVRSSIYRARARITCNVRSRNAYVSASRRWLSDYNLEQTDMKGLSHYEIFPEIPEFWKYVAGGLRVRWCMPMPTRSTGRTALLSGFAGRCGPGMTLQAMSPALLSSARISPSIDRYWRKDESAALHRALAARPETHRHHAMRLGMRSMSCQPVSIAGEFPTLPKAKPELRRRRWRAKACCRSSTGATLPVRSLFWEHEGNHAVREGKWKLVSRFPNSWELYDMERDGWGMHDLADAGFPTASRRWRTTTPRGPGAPACNHGRCRRRRTTRFARAP